MPKLNKIPFLAAALLLLGIAAVIARQISPITFREVALCAGLGMIAAIIAIIPFILEYKAAVKFGESDKLHDTVAQISQLDQVAKQIASATAQWQDVQTAAGKTATAAKEISDRMTVEVENFTEFMKQTNDSEKSALRLEVEKLRRAEGDWLQITVRILDHIFALNQAAARSGQPELIAQLGHFQNACRDVARRVGLIPFAAAPDEVFDDKRHKLLDSEKAAEGACIAETLAPGFTFQGQPLRPALVKLKTAETAQAETTAPAEPAEPTLL